jgi:hypothetical protein
LFPVRVVVEVGRGCAGHRDQSILGVVVQREVVKVRLLLETCGHTSAGTESRTEQS